MGDRIARVLGWWLQRANAADLYVYRREFYALKDRLLRRWGEHVGHDVQHIVDACWGDYDGAGCAGRHCRRCGGTGVWRERWVLLERWALGGRVFHRPVGPVALCARTVLVARGASVIEGRIRHYGDEKAHREALLWLTLFLAPRLWWRLLRASAFYGWRGVWWRPMLALQRVVFTVCGWALRLNAWRTDHWRRCYNCQSRYWTWRARAELCAVCRAMWPAWDADDDLPF